jgi:hypothetical protein
MACPFFMPGARHDAELWQHRQRLPLGDGFTGCCMAAGRDGGACGDEELRNLCNIGYAKGCASLPSTREADAVRFVVSRDSGNSISVQWVFEREYLPVANGTLEYDFVSARWVSPHVNAVVQRMAECYLESYLARHPRQRAVGRND